MFIKVVIQKQFFHIIIGFIIVLKDSGYGNGNKLSRLIYEYPKHLKNYQASKGNLTL